ncbi:MAG: hypothetical protein Q9181_008244 [Wetmoreana brouardii]
MALHYTPDLTLTHACEATIGYRFHKPTLLWEALQADGSVIYSSGSPRYEEGNKRLAIVGDKILDFLLSLKWYHTWEKRVVFDKLRNEVTSNASLDTRGLANSLDRYISQAPGSYVVMPKTMSATIEAIVGAAFLDGGMDAVKQVVQKLGIDVV